MSTGSVQEFRPSAWNSSTENVWTSVQDSSAWPVNQQNPQITNKKNVNSKTNQATVTTNPPNAFQWSNSWDPVLAAQQIRPQQKKVTNVQNPNPTILKKDPKKAVPAPISAPVMNPQQTQYDIQLIPAYPISPQMIHPIAISTELPPTQLETLYDYGNAEANLAALQAFAIANSKKKKKTTEEKQLIEEELSKQNLYKTELCRSFCETGMCRYGHKCQFAHGEHELRPVLRHPKYKTETCKTFSNSGTCPYGNRCRFVHPGVTFGSWDDNTLITGMIPLLPEGLIGVMDQLSLNGMIHPHFRQQNIVPSSSPIQFNQHIPVDSEQQQQQSPKQQSTISPATFVAPTKTTELKDKESDVKAHDDEDSDSKPRLAFFQNLTVI